MTGNFLIYGANGYTGELITRFAAERGLKPILAGRSEEKIEPIAKRHGVKHRAFALEDTAKLDAELQEVDVVLHCAGPFSLTSKPVVDACVRNKKHYTDITGEIAVFEACGARDKEAKQAGVMLTPGVGFDVVPSDCLARHLKDRLPTATNLSLAFYGMGRLSHGTQATMTMNVGKGGAIRRDGKITTVPAAWRTREIDFGEVTKTGVTIPRGRRRDGLLLDRHSEHRGLHGSPAVEPQNAKAQPLPRLAACDKTFTRLSTKTDRAGRADRRRARKGTNADVGRGNR